MPASVPAATSELDAVNVMLDTIGESPVNSIASAAQNVDVSRALKLLREVSKAVQMEGWHFNKEEDYSLLPDQDGYITIPTNAISVDADQYAGTYDIVVRGTKLYDRKNHTDVFTVTELKVEITFYLSFSEIPEAARQYITIRAARKFQDRSVGSETLHKFNAADEARARATLERQEGLTGDQTIFDEQSRRQIVNRGTQRRYGW